ncbi:hypothetical protein ABZ654_39080, partial [Streptomyces hygroscopicus]|uniref:hypothetical protein n=1 Tax=Streptomyces hygroscopicus TaxID=1912 RepID=UPI0033FBBA6A
MPGSLRTVAFLHSYAFALSATRSGVGDALVGAVGVVELPVLVQGVQEVALVTSAGLYPPFDERVHSRHLDAAENDCDPRVRE